MSFKIEHIKTARVSEQMSICIDVLNDQRLFKIKKKNKNFFCKLRQEYTKCLTMITNTGNT